MEYAAYGDIFEYGDHDYGDAHTSRTYKHNPVYPSMAVNMDPGGMVRKCLTLALVFAAIPAILRAAFRTIFLLEFLFFLSPATLFWVCIVWYACINYLSHQEGNSDDSGGEGAADVDGGVHIAYGGTCMSPAISLGMAFQLPFKIQREYLLQSITLTFVSAALCTFARNFLEELIGSFASVFSYFGFIIQLIVILGFAKQAVGFVRAPSTATRRVPPKYY